METPRACGATLVPTRPGGRQRGSARAERLGRSKNDRSYLMAISWAGTNSLGALSRLVEGTILLKSRRWIHGRAAPVLWTATDPSTKRPRVPHQRPERMTGSGSATFSEPPRSAAGAGVPPGLPLDVASNQSVSRHGTERNHDLLHSGAHGQNAEAKAGSAASTSASEGRTEGMRLVGWFVGRLRPTCEPRSRTQGTYPTEWYAR